jgi:hypothetical protein
MSLRYWYARTQNHWMCKELSSSAASTDLRTSRQASGWRTEGCGGVLRICKCKSKCILSSWK